MKNDRDMVPPRDCWHVNQPIVPQFLTGKEASKETVLDLSKICPLLNTLHLSGLCLTSGYSLIPFLPDSITDLTITGHYSQKSPLQGLGEDGNLYPAPFKFPSLLVSLKLPLCQTFSEYHLLPISLTSLQVPTAGAPETFPIIQPTLPPSLTLCHAPMQPLLSLFTLAIPSTVLTHGNASFVRDTMTFLAPPSFVSSSTLIFPSTLTELRVTRSIGGARMLEFLSLLKQQAPQLSILDLDTASPLLLGDECIELLPPQLNKLSFAYSESFTEKSYGMFPRGLKRLAIHRYQRHAMMSHNSPAFAHLPSKLEYLALQNVSTLSPAVFGMLPKTITQLRTWELHFQEAFDALPNVPPALDSISLTSTCRLTAEKAKALPPQLRNLTFLFEASIPADVMAALPRGLVALSAASAPINDDACAFLPPTLNYLWNRENSLITDLGVSRLPLSITGLGLGSSKTGLSATGFARLQGLKTLDLKGTCYWTDDSLKELPRTLEELSINSATLLTDACIPHLPCSLKSLLIRLNRNLTPSMLHLLPPKLAFINLKKNVNFKMKHIPLLPYGLEIHSKKLKLGPPEFC